MQHQTPKTPETHNPGQQQKPFKQQPGKTGQNPTTSYQYPSQKPEQSQKGGKRGDAFEGETDTEKEKEEK
ncbi:MAG: hypothetical protein Q8P84_01205 [Deltaproteobacteria bacterium]|nr:hypothetical protein [Deltaproteobacteria bacterium]MDZ4224869.1 hypothetical protein [bacterium]